MYKYEVEDLTNGRYCTAQYSNHEYKNGILEVWVRNVHTPAKSTACH